MPVQAILNEVDQLQSVGTRPEGLAEQHPPVSEALMAIAGECSQHCRRIGGIGGDSKPQADLAQQSLQEPIGTRPASTPACLLG